MDVVRDKGILYWPRPAKGPDLNPIENFWHKLKHFLCVIVKPMNKELIQEIHWFWDTVTPEKCKLYISHLNKVLPAVVEHEGRGAGYCIYPNPDK